MAKDTSKGGYSTAGKLSDATAKALPEIRKYQKELAAADRDLRQNPPGRSRR